MLFAPLVAAVALLVTLTISVLYLVLYSVYCGFLYYIQAGDVVHRSVHLVSVQQFCNLSILEYFADLDSIHSTYAAH